MNKSRFILIIEYRVRKVIRGLIPAYIWNQIRPPESNRNYQGVSLKFTMRHLHSGRFDFAHTKFSKQDLHLKGDIDKTRLRTYTVTSVCNLALNLSESKKGNLLVAGVSYGTAPLVMCETLNEKIIGREIHLIDPFLGVENSADSAKSRNYNTDPSLVLSRMPKNLNVKIQKSFLTPEVVKNVGPLIFAHLNTTDFKAEKTIIPTIYQNLEKGGFLVFDLYGFLAPSDQEQVDQLLSSLNAESFECVTRQLVVYKT